jgi:hypothetical protein
MVAKAAYTATRRRHMLLVFKPRPYDEQTDCIFAEILESIGRSEFCVTAGRIQDSRQTYSVLQIRHIAHPNAVIGDGTVLAVVKAIQENSNLSFMLVATANADMTGELEYRWASDLAEFEQICDDTESQAITEQQLEQRRLRQEETLRRLQAAAGQND